MSDWQISLLGPLELTRGPSDLTPSAPKLRRVLVTLLLNVNLVTTVEQLFAELWEDRPPPSAHTTMQTYIYQLRRHLDLGTGLVVDRESPVSGHPRLITRMGGYELRLDDPQILDVHRFNRLVGKGRAEQDGGELEQAAETFGRALSLWRGPALVDVPTGQRLSAWATQLEERRTGTLERRFRALLDLGRHHEITDEITVALHAHPTHEGLAGQLMLALHRSGRRPDALGVFRRIRHRLIEELGLDPSVNLQRMHQAVLADDPVLHAEARSRPAVAASSRIVPAQLPPAIGDFVARGHQLGEAADVLTTSRLHGSGMPVVEVHGPPGIGKTTFAVHLAHQMRSHYPDGQVFIDVSRVGTEEVPLSDVLAAVLRSCGLPRDGLPQGEDELSRMFRSWAADRRLLLVMDDVRDAELLRPLLPGGRGCGVITTSRYRGQGFPGCYRIDLTALDTGEALELLAKIAGLWRIEDEAESLGELVQLCEGSPWALRGIAARLACRPGWPASRLVDRLRFQDWKLTKFTAGWSGLVGIVNDCCARMTEDQRYLLRLMAEGIAERWTVGDVAGLLGGSLTEAEDLIDRLMDLHLVQELVLPFAVGDPGSTPARHREPHYVMSRLTAMAVQSVLKVDCPATVGVS